MSNKLCIVIKGLLCNPSYRFSILSRYGYYNHLSDEEYIKMTYKLKMGKELDLDNPTSFNEKIQWLKLHDRDPKYTQMVDKYEAKKYVSELIGEEYIVPTLGVWDHFSEIDMATLPNQFVIKCTHDSGGLFICRDKTTIDISRAKKVINSSLRRNFYYRGREWPYKNVKPRIMAEQYLEDNQEMSTGTGKTHEMVDYKFYCFDGKPEFLYISEGLENHRTARISFLNLDWSFADFQRADYKQHETLPQKPEAFEQMLEIAQKLSAGFPFLRVDLYNVNKHIYFSELTFSPCGGMMPFNPPEWDKKVGTLLNISK